MNKRKTAEKRIRKKCIQDYSKNNQACKKILKHRVDLFKSLAIEDPCFICVI